MLITHKFGQQSVMVVIALFKFVHLKTTKRCNIVPVSDNVWNVYLVFLNLIKLSNSNSVLLLNMQCMMYH